MAAVHFEGPLCSRMPRQVVPVLPQAVGQRNRQGILKLGGLQQRPEQRRGREVSN